MKRILPFVLLLVTLALAAAYFPPKFQPDELEDTSLSTVQEQNRIAFTLALFTFYDEHCEKAFEVGARERRHSHHDGRQETARRK